MSRYNRGYNMSRGHNIRYSDPFPPRNIEGFKIIAKDVFGGK